ncbi:MAG: hypothetical protein WCK89_01780 [bacterium]
MNTPINRWIKGLLVGMLSASALGETALRTAALDAGGGRSAAGAVTLDASLGGVGGLGVQDATVLKSGYIGQLFDLSGLIVTASPTNVPEQGTRQLSAAAAYDDATAGALDGTPQWSVAWGPLTGVSGGGMATAGAVYQDTPASARAAFDGLQGTVALLVLDSTPDNYGLYAGDGLPDVWQVGYFGIDNADGLSAADPDHDTVPNRDEYQADTSPTNSASVLRMTSVASAGAAGVRVAWQGGVQAVQVLQRRPSLADGPWEDVMTNLPPTATAADWLDPAGATQGTGFYRVHASR